jgi:hypothetical protein
MAVFNAPVDEAGMQHMQGYADMIRDNVMRREGISDEEREEAASCCTAEVVVDVIREDLIRDFRENGLSAGSSYARGFLAGPVGSGWPSWSPPNEGARYGPVGATSGSWSFLCQAVTGLDFWEGLE